MIANAEADRFAQENVWRNTRAIFDGEPSSDLLSSDQATPGRQPEPYASPVSAVAPSKTAALSPQSALLCGIVIFVVAIGAVNATLTLRNKVDPDALAEPVRQIGELARTVTGLEQRVETLSTDSTRWASRTETEAAEAALERKIGQLSDRLDRTRDEAQAQDANTQLRLTRIEANEAMATRAPATFSIYANPADDATALPAGYRETTDSASVVASQGPKPATTAAAEPNGKKSKKTSKLHRRRLSLSGKNKDAALSPDDRPGKPH